MANFLGDLVNRVPTHLHNLVSTAPLNPFQRTKWDQNRSSLPLAYEPGDWDVCCGRGKRNWNHKGNVRFRNLVQSNVKRYIDAPTRNDKTQVVISVVDFVRGKGGHFLKQEKSGRWYDIGDAEARDKVGHSLRDQVTALQRQKTNKAVFAKMRRGSMERHSSTQSDSGNEMDIRKSSKTISSLVRCSFERRPSFIFDSYVSHESSQKRAAALTNGDEALSWRITSLRRSSNWEFLDSLEDILGLVANEESCNSSSKFIENLDRVDQSLYMDDTPLRLSDAIESIEAFSLGESEGIEEPFGGARPPPTQSH